MKACLPFPSNKKTKHAIILINSDNLYSAIMDGIHLPKLFNDMLKFDDILIIANCKNSMDKIQAKLTEYKNITYSICNSKNMLAQTIKNTIAKIHGELVFIISSHGYARGNMNYINYAGSQIYDYEWNDYIQSPLNNDAECLVLVDACQSGTELNLNYKTTDLVNYSNENVGKNNIKNIICIGAVDDNQYDEDNISELGFGGGLSSAFIDYCYENKDKTKTIGNFFLFYQNRMKISGKQSILSFNNMDFLKKNN